jgi:uncharacterized protein with FMN-binding domain
MRRVIVALFAMTTGTALLVGLKSQVLGGPLGLVAEAPFDPDVSGDGMPLDATGGPGPGGSPAAGRTMLAGKMPPGATPGAGGTASPGAIAPSQAKTTTPALAPAGTATVTGAAIAVQTARSPTTKSSSCGDCHDYSMSVTITVTGGRITKATVAYNPPPGGSISYANKATNVLSPKILTAQTWNLGPVSGATYSGNAFELSVKDAMVKAGLPT